MRILLFGGFEVWSGERQIRSFESQKVRALFAYLLCNRGRTFSREAIAGLLWPERDEESARRNLRQALYNLRSSLPDAPGDPILQVDSGEIAIDPGADLWLDLTAFADALGIQREGGFSEPHDLVRGINLYRGDLLAGLYLKDSLDFEEWLVTERERYRDAAISALRSLMDAYLSRGEYRLGIQFARRLLSMDPLSEESHRYLMRAFVLSGRRHQALAHYEQLCELLERELGVEPLEETRELFQQILESEARDADREDQASAESIGPILPLVGRSDLLEELRETWGQVLDGAGRVTWVQGEAGVGKTRLVRSFLDLATSQRRATVLLARGEDIEPAPAFGVLVQLLRHALADDSVEMNDRLEEIPSRELLELAHLLPELAELRPEAAAPRRASRGSRGRLLDGARHLLATLCGPSRAYESGDPLIVFIDDLPWIDRDSVDFLESLATGLADLPIWLILVGSSGGGCGDHPFFSRLETGDPYSVIEVQRLEGEAIEELATSFIETSQVDRFLELLDGDGRGLPLRIATLINLLWDEGLLRPCEGREWRFEASAEDLAARSGDALEDLILRRVRRLPASTRRLLTLAAVTGQRFDIDLLRVAEGERAEVVALGLELLLERWLLRRHAQFWAASSPQSELVSWASGARHGSFEFDHAEIRRAVYANLNPLRRQALHRDVGRALEALHGAEPAAPAEWLAHHFLAASEWRQAAKWLEVAARRAADRLSPDAACACYQKELQVLETLSKAGRTEGDREKYEAEMERVHEARARLSPETQESRAR